MFSSGMMVSRHYTPPCTDCSSTLSACLSLALCHNSLPLPAAPLNRNTTEWELVVEDLTGCLAGECNHVWGRFDVSFRVRSPKPRVPTARTTHSRPSHRRWMGRASQTHTTARHGTPRPPCRVGCKMRHEVERTTSFLSTNNTTFGSNKNIPCRLSLSCSYK